MRTYTVTHTFLHADPFIVFSGGRVLFRSIYYSFYIIRLSFGKKSLSSQPITECTVHPKWQRKSCNIFFKNETWTTRAFALKNVQVPNRKNELKMNH